MHISEINGSNESICTRKKTRTQGMSRKYTDRGDWIFFHSQIRTVKPLYVTSKLFWLIKYR